MQNYIQSLQQQLALKLFNGTQTSSLQKEIFITCFFEPFQGSMTNVGVEKRQSGQTQESQTSETLGLLRLSQDPFQLYKSPGTFRVARLGIKMLKRGWSFMQIFRKGVFLRQGCSNTLVGIAVALHTRNSHYLTKIQHKIILPMREIVII